MTTPDDRSARSWRACMKETTRGWRDHRTGLMAPTLAFYTLLSMVPMLLLAAAALRPWLTRDEVRRGLLEGLRSISGDPAFEVFRGFLAEARPDPDRWTATAVGIVILVYAASRLFVALRRALAVVWDRPASDSTKEHVLDTLRHQGFAVAMVAVVLALWFAGLLATLAIEGVRRNVPDLPFTFDLSGWLHLALSIVLPAVGCAVLYRVGPASGVRWRHAWVGGTFAAVLIAAGQKVLGVFVARLAFPTLFGAAGSLVLVLLWFQVVWLLFLIGAEFTRALGRTSRGPSR